MTDRPNKNPHNNVKMLMEFVGLKYRDKLYFCGGTKYTYPSAKLCCRKDFEIVQIILRGEYVSVISGYSAGAISTNITYADPQIAEKVQENMGRIIYEYSVKNNISFDL